MLLCASIYVYPTDSDKKPALIHGVLPMVFFLISGFVSSLLCEHTLVLVSTANARSQTMRKSRDYMDIQERNGRPAACSPRSIPRDGILIYRS